MNKLLRNKIVSCAACGLFFMTSASAGDECTPDSASCTTTVVYGERVAHGVLVNTPNGFETIEPGITDEEAILYNQPSDGSEPVPLREMPTLYITDGDMPVVISEQISAEQPMRGLAIPADPITAGSWFEGGDSKLVIKQLRDGTNKVTLIATGLVPNALYGVWQFNEMPGAPGPFGGIPNILATDAKGNAKLKRTLPYDLQALAARLVLVYHSDHRVYGGTPSLINPMGGDDIHAHVEFNL